MGRNIWQSENPVPMIRAVRTIVHSNYTTEQAYKMYLDLCKNSNKEYPKKQFNGGNPNKNSNKSTDKKYAKKQFNGGNPNKNSSKEYPKKQFKSQQKQSKITPTKQKTQFTLNV